MENTNMEKTTATSLIYGKLAEIMRNLNAIKKEKSGPGYKFRGIDDIYNALHAHFATAGVIITSEVLDNQREERTAKSGSLMLYVVLTVKFSYWAEDGSVISCVVVGEAMDMSDKATQKAMSNALKYALMQTFLIPTDDPKNSTAEVELKQVKSSTVPEEVLEKIHSLKNVEELQKFYQSYPQYKENKTFLDALKVQKSALLQA